MPDALALRPLPEPDNAASLPATAGRWLRFLTTEHTDRTVNPDPHGQYKFRGEPDAPGESGAIVDGFFTMTPDGAVTLLPEVLAGTTHPYFELLENGDVRLKSEVDSGVAETRLFKLLPDGSVAPKTKSEATVVRMTQADRDRLSALETTLEAVLARLNALEGKSL